MRTFASDDADGHACPNARATRGTKHALCVRFADGIEHWIPKSQIHDNSEVYESGHVGTLIVTTWLAEKIGL